MEVATIGLDIAKNVFRVHGIEVEMRDEVLKALDGGEPQFSRNRFG